MGNYDPIVYADRPDVVTVSNLLSNILAMGDLVHYTTITGPLTHLPHNTVSYGHWYLRLLNATCVSTNCNST